MTEVTTGPIRRRQSPPLAQHHAMASGRASKRLGGRPGVFVPEPISTDYREGYDQARRAFLIGQAVRERRLALGLSQTDVAASAGMTQPALSRLEAGGAVPTIPVLERIAVALGAELIVALAPHAA